MKTSQDIRGTRRGLNRASSKYKTPVVLLTKLRCTECVDFRALTRQFCVARPDICRFYVPFLPYI